MLVPRFWHSSLRAIPTVVSPVVHQPPEHRPLATSRQLHEQRWSHPQGQLVGWDTGSSWGGGRRSTGRGSWERLSSTADTVPSWSPPQRVWGLHLGKKTPAQMHPCFTRLPAQGWAARCISRGEKPSKTIGMRTFMTCADLTARWDRCNRPTRPAASQHIPPSELCEWIQAGGGSQASSLLVTPLFKTQSPSVLRGQALSEARELLGMVGCWRRAWGPPEAAIASKQPQNPELRAAKVLGEGKCTPKQAALHHPGQALPVQIQPGARWIHPRTSGARVKPAGHKAPKIIHDPSLPTESREGGGMGREGSRGCQECVRAAADKSGAGPLGGDLFCFLVMLIGLTWRMGIRLRDGPLPRWLHPREGDILPTAVWGREGTRGG